MVKTNVKAMTVTAIFFISKSFIQYLTLVRRAGFFYFPVTYIKGI
jgi:hypothetical protein